MTPCTLPDALPSGATDTVLNPPGVPVVIQAEHLCTPRRGVQTAGALTTTSAFRGARAQPGRLIVPD